MAYSNPPFTNAGSFALPAGNGSVNPIAAPGAGLALRITGGIVGINRGVTGNVDLVVVDSTSAVFIARVGGLTVAGQPNQWIMIPEPGIQLPSNTALQIQTNASAAAGSAIWTFYYYIDNVS